MHFQVQVPRASTVGSRFALSGETDQLLLGDSSRNRDLHRVGLEVECAVRLQLGPFELESPCGAREGLLEIDIDTGVVITPRTTASPACGCEGTASASAAEKR